MRYRLTYLDIDTRQSIQFGSHLRNDFLLGAFAEFERRFDFRDIDTKRMLVEFGAACLSCDSLYLRNSQKEFLSPAAHIV